MRKIWSASSSGRTSRAGESPASTANSVSSLAQMLFTVPMKPS
jgi:hypothetical protein